MYCPVCGQQQISENIKYCSRCGFQLAGIAQVIANHGIIPFVSPSINRKLVSPRKRGLKQGLFILLIGMFLIVPLMGMLTVMLGIEPFLVGVFTILSFFGGILRMLYALFFEDGGEPTVPDKLLPDGVNFIASFKKQNESNALPPQPANSEMSNPAYAPPAAQFQTRGDWREANTGKLVSPSSVTEGTTKLLEKNE